MLKTCIAPKWTGIWGAFDTKPPSSPNSAHEKSKRSLILVEIDVLCRILKQLSVTTMPKSGNQVILPSHLFSNTHKSVRKNAQLNRIKFRPNFLHFAWTYGDFDISKFSDQSGASRFHQDSAKLIHNYGRTCSATI